MDNTQIAILTLAVQVRLRDPPALLPDSDSPRPRRRCSSSPTAGTPPGRLPGSSEAAAAAGKLDRLGRNLAHLVNAVQDLAAHGVRPAVLVSRAQRACRPTEHTAPGKTHECHSKGNRRPAK